MGDPVEVRPAEPGPLAGQIGGAAVGGRSSVPTSGTDDSPSTSGGRSVPGIRACNGGTPTVVTQSTKRRRATTAAAAGVRMAAGESLIPSL